MGFFSAVKKFFASGNAQKAEDAPLRTQAVASGRDSTEQDSLGGEDALVVRLRAAEPNLSSWLGIVLEGVDGVGDLLFERLAFLLRVLETPDAEAEEFLADFRAWLVRNEYEKLSEFRSELQYRLAIALELEDEEDERERIFLKLRDGLARTREQFALHFDELFAQHVKLTADFWNELEEIFIMADLGYEPAKDLIQRLKRRAQRQKIDNPAQVRELLGEELREIFQKPKAISAFNVPEVILLVGVNGAGKTTTIAKLAHRARMQGKKVLIVAADTFRAAAIDQLEVWAKRVGAAFYAKEPGADPASVVWEAMELAMREEVDLVLVDTAGRLQTKTNLMAELGKIRQVLGRKHPGAPHRSILVLDATTGQNALSQAKLFREAAKISELILTKLDGTAKGGVAIAVAMQESLPITYVGLGEKLEDLRAFDGAAFAKVLLGSEENN